MDVLNSFIYGDFVHLQSKELSESDRFDLVSFLKGVQQDIDNSLQENYSIDDPIELKIRAVATKSKRGWKLSILELNEKVEAHYIQEVTIKLTKKTPMHVAIGKSRYG